MAQQTAEKNDAGKFTPIGPGHLLLLWLAGVSYAGLCMLHWIARPVARGLVFNEMLSNLLHGRFDISLVNIANEGYLFQGKIYAYFGVFCALLRLPLLLTGHNGVDMTGISLLIAAAISLACRLYIVAAILNRAGTANPLLRWAILAAVVTNGESIQYLVPSIYQEVVSWGAALASIFVLIALRMVLGFTKQSAANYATLALVAGLAMLCRVTFGLGLYCALVLMAWVRILQSLRIPGRLFPCMRQLAPAVSVLALFAIVAGGVNYARWENPLTFMPLDMRKVGDKDFPARMARMARYGGVNIGRVPFGLQYYFAPVWVLTDRTGKMISQSEQERLYDGVEFPPGSLFLSDSVICILAFAGLGSIASRSRHIHEPALATAALVGLALPIYVVLATTYLAFRYRMEFYPVLDFAACIGLANIVRSDGPLPKFLAPLFGWLCASAMAAALVSFLSYLLIGFGPATDFNISRGWIGLLEDKVAGKNIYLKSPPPTRDLLQPPRNLERVPGQ